MTVVKKYRRVDRVVGGVVFENIANLAGDVGGIALQRKYLRWDRAGRVR